MNVFRRLSTPRLLLLVTTLVAVVVAGTLGGLAASRSAGAAPAGEPLAQAVHDALTAPNPQGIDARVTFTNNLLPSSSLLGNVTSALISGASGRLWLSSDGRGRIELQSDAGDTQIVWDSSKVTVYDSSANTAYELALPAQSSSDTTTHQPPTLDEISKALTKLEQHANVSDAQPDVVVGQGAYAVTVSPKENAGLFGDAQLEWAAANGVPLRIAITAKGEASPVLELKVTDISFDAVDSADVGISPPAGTKIVQLTPPAKESTRSGAQPVTGVDAVRAAVSFPLAAPSDVGGRPLTSARLVGKGALLTYGEGLGALVVHESSADGGGAPAGPMGSLPKVSLGSVSAHELATPLGTALAFSNGGVSFVVGGSMTTSDAEAAAKAFA